MRILIINTNTNGRCIYQLKTMEPNTMEYKSLIYYAFALHDTTYIIIGLKDIITILNTPYASVAG